MTSITWQKHELRNSIADRVMRSYNERNEADRHALFYRMIFQLGQRMTLEELQSWSDKLATVEPAMKPTEPAEYVQVSVRRDVAGELMVAADKGQLDDVLTWPDCEEFFSALTRAVYGGPS